MGWYIAETQRVERSVSMSHGLRLLVVTTDEEGMYHEIEKVYAVRFRSLGITAYGYTEAEARKKVQTMFSCKVKAHAKHGSLETWLDASGVEWRFDDEVEQQPSWRPLAASTSEPVTAFV